MKPSALVPALLAALFISEPTFAQAAHIPGPDSLASCATTQAQPVDAPYLVKARAPDAPLVVFVHGGGWRRGDASQAEALAPYFTQQGMAFAAVNYRLYPNADVTQQALDVCAAVQSLRRSASQSGFDKNAIILVGHSAGAELAALAAPFLPTKALVLLDPVGLDIASEVAVVPGLARIFGNDQQKWQEISPVSEVDEGAKYPPVFIAYTDFRPDTKLQALAMTNALKSKGIPVETSFYPGLRHGSFFMNLTKTTSIASEVKAFLAARK